MIRNEKEYAVAKAELHRFQNALENFNVLDEIEAGVDPVIARSHKNSYAKKVDGLRNDIRDYEDLVEGRAGHLSISNLNSIGKTLISARLARGMTQRALAEATGLKEQQIQRYEKEEYCSANIRRLSLVARALSLRFDGAFTSAHIGSVGADQLLGGMKVEDFPFAAMRKRGWFGGKAMQPRVSSDDKKASIIRFLSEAPAMPNIALHRKTVGAVDEKRAASLLAWQARVLYRASEMAESFPRYSPLDAFTINSIVKMSRDKDGAIKAVNTLARHGIICVFEEHLPSTKIDGAALSLRGRQAVIAMSLRYNRWDNFWFVLLHEMGHISRHWDHVNDVGIMDENIGHEQSELMEREADEFASNAIVPALVWENAMVRYSRDPEQVLKFAERQGVHPALIAGRIRRERGFTEFPDLVGEGEVRALMSSAGYWSDML